MQQPMMAQLTASFQDEEFSIAWDLGGCEVNQQIWDRIEIKSAKDDMFAATALTQSSLQSDCVTIPLQAPVQFGSPYYATYISAESDTVVAKSEPFIPMEDANGSRLTEKDICKITISEGPIKIVENDSPNLRITIEWDFPEHIPKSIGQSDKLCIIPVERLDDFKNCYYEYPYAFASGKASGWVEMRLGGFVESGSTYLVVYLESTNQFRLGVSPPFAVTDDLEVDDMTLLTTVKPATMTFNMSSMMQYLSQEHKSKSRATPANPLLTIIPQKSKWEAMLADQKVQEKRAKQEVEDEKETAIASQQELSGGEEVPFEQDDLLDEDSIEDEFVSAINGKPAFLFAGAGISMSAPSSSPSWWALMSQLLKLTFDAMPQKHEKDARKLHTSDNSRNPEEVMESYYFILQEKLFSLFELLEAGEPNANHKIIAKMAKHGKLKTILTTNFDIFIERALDAEGVPYKVICTNEEYKDYFMNGIDTFAVLKIHGSISRPETIVAVANHYKTGKGFGGWKATVMQHFVQNYPTIFLGYSGWDFYHANYQQFWEAAGKVGGERIFFLKYKGAKGGPLISKLVGKHVGSERLVMGEGILPDWACSVMKGYDCEGAKQVMDFHFNVDVEAAKKLVEEKRHAFITNWVSQIPPASMLTLLMEEAGRLSDFAKKRRERMKENKDEGDTTTSLGDPNAMSAYFMTLAMEMAQGKITMEEYTEKQQMATMEMTFTSVILPKDKKAELLKLYLKLNKTHPIFSGADSTTYGTVLPLMLSHIAEVAAYKSAQGILDEAIAYVENVVEPLRIKKESGDRKSDVLHHLYLYHSMILRLEGEEREEFEGLYDNFATEAAAKGWDDELIANRIAQDLSPKLTRATFDQIDLKAIVKSQVESTIDISFRGNKCANEFLESAMMIALGLYRQAKHLITDLLRMEEVNKMIQMLAQDEDKDIPISNFEALEESLNEDVNPVLAMLQSMVTQGIKGELLTPQEVLASFKLANAEILRVVFQSSASGYQQQLAREFQGYYPKECLPKCVARFLSKQLLEVVGNIEDDRAEQPLYGMLVILGECTGDIDQMQNAVNRSLELTEGKITELTPYPIPESLAYAYQEAGDMENAMKYYKLALEGIRTFVMRQKTDAIVLNACLVQSQFNKEEALRMAFEFSPHYSDVQQFGIVGAGRGLLVQQCEAWASELSFPSVDAAKAALTKKE